MNSKIEVRNTKRFRIDLKALLKKYPSLTSELRELQSQLLHDPFSGTSLGSDIYKIRLAIKSKGKGRSGGARVITFVEQEIVLLVSKLQTEIVTVNLITIYDKSEVGNIPISELKKWISDMEFE